MKLLSLPLLIVVVLNLAACQGAPASSAAPTPAPMIASETLLAAPAISTETSASGDGQIVFKTTIGDFAITGSRFVAEANGTRPGPDEKLPLVFLARPGVEKLNPGEFSLEAFDQALRDLSQGEVHIAGDDGSYTICTMGGWVEDDFAIGFRVPASAKTYTLFWPGNDPIELSPE